MTLTDFVAFTATNHAKVYGLHPRKGAIAIGADADIAIWDPKRTVKITAAELHHGADYTPYEGFEVTGWPVTTIVRGKVIVDRGKLIGSMQHGCLLQARSLRLCRAGQRAGDGLRMSVAHSPLVMPALVAGIHVFLAASQQTRGWPGHKRVHAHLRRAMPGHDAAVDS
jgi:hypothetical protein